jgi:putative tricarboxylic transport membrane protein
VNTTIGGDKMKTSKLNADVIVGIILMLAGAYFYSLALKMNPNAAIFPKIVIGAFILLSFGMTIQGFIRGKNGDENVSSIKLSELKIPLLIFVFITGYVVALEFVGFYVATAIFIPIVAGFYKNKKPICIIATTLGMIGFIHLLFVVQLKLVLP